MTLVRHKIAIYPKEALDDVGFTMPIHNLKKKTSAVESASFHSTLRILRKLSFAMSPRLCFRFLIFFRFAFQGSETRDWKWALENPQLPFQVD